MSLNLVEKALYKCIIIIIIIIKRLTYTLENTVVIVSNWFMVSMHLLSYGCTLEVAKHGSVRVAQGDGS